MTTSIKTGIGARVRAVFEATSDELCMADICAALGIVTGKDRKRVAWATRDLVAAGYVSQSGERLHSRYRSTGKVQVLRQPLSPDELRQYQRQASQRYRARHPERVRELERARRRPAKARPAARQPRLARVGLGAANIPAPAAGARAVRPVETVAEFEARGGRVEVLPVYWRAA
ncbi:hypothetical protein P6166_04555 [Stenotrophomonas sp. HITSZ_GD]|uniref:hypothetical protein n=1 Tax=Stenotrophomonas sp. HITSZ_GD TaxID=3037248 RepID=UPI00240D9976|nr:hypothetical protein [Stenotrophomonas sp. HITSZ_GD]MDG2524628.1 hypothetical protein [Stenotrophomonas sp. HITSZ_GD]